MLPAKGPKAIPTVPAEPPAPPAILYSCTASSSEYQSKSLKESTIRQKDGRSENTSRSEVAANSQGNILETLRSIDALTALLRLCILLMIIASFICIDKWCAKIKSAISIGKMNHTYSDSYECNNYDRNFDRIVNEKHSNRCIQSFKRERMFFISLHERRIFFCLLFHVLVSSTFGAHCDFDCLNPRRPVTEELFNKIGHHERSSDFKEMTEKLQVVRDRRHWQPWDMTNPYVKNVLQEKSGNVLSEKRILLESSLYFNSSSSVSNIDSYGRNRNDNRNEYDGDSNYYENDDNNNDNNNNNNNQNDHNRNDHNRNSNKDENVNFQDVKSNIRTRKLNEKKKITKTAAESLKAVKTAMPNILFMMADDLGYGDLSVFPFLTPNPHPDDPCEEGSILTPNLEMMAKKGIVLSNFHSASPVCSPSRAAVTTGLYPWRLDALNAFELGKDMSQRNGYLPQVPTGAEILRGAGYYTSHSGKWHLGGMREENRIARAYSDKCVRPSPNQHGFEEYISELDGPESARYTFLNRNSELHSKGHRHLLKDDIPMPVIENKGENVLSDREASDAIAVMRENKEKRPGQPWFIQVWFNAPHGPWEVLKSGEQVYSAHYDKPADHWDKYICTAKGSNEKYPLKEARSWQYKTMVSAMDKSIGMLLTAVKDLGFEDNTLIVFTSDNGPENGAGMSGPYRERKRSLQEGGIRVPCIIQWVNQIQPGDITNTWAANTDFIPTFLEAAGVVKPSHVKFDGTSFLGVVTQKKIAGTHGHANEYGHNGTTSGDSTEKEKREHKRHHRDQEKDKMNVQNTNVLTGRRLIEYSDDGTNVKNRGRVFLWHKDTEKTHYDERVMSAAYMDDVKVITEGKEGCIVRIFDLKRDPYEAKNLVTGPGCSSHFSKYDLSVLSSVVNNDAGKNYCSEKNQNQIPDKLSGKDLNRRRRELRWENGDNGNNGENERSKEHYKRYEGNEEMKENKEMNKNNHEIKYNMIPAVRTPNTVRSLSTLDPISQCMVKYHKNIVAKMTVMMPKLAVFVKYGNTAHSQFLKEQHDNKAIISKSNSSTDITLNIATCSHLSLPFSLSLAGEFSPGCVERLECTVPDY